MSHCDLFNRSVQGKSAVGCCKRETSSRGSKAGERERGKHPKERSQRREERSLKSTRYKTAELYRASYSYPLEERNLSVNHKLPFSKIVRMRSGGLLWEFRLSGTTFFCYFFRSLSGSCGPDNGEKRTRQPGLKFIIKKANNWALDYIREVNKWLRWWINWI